MCFSVKVLDPSTKLSFVKDLFSGFLSLLGVSISGPSNILIELLVFEEPPPLCSTKELVFGIALSIAMRSFQIVHCL